MYLVTWDDHDAKVEASLGGRVTVEEMTVFAEELKAVVEEFGSQPYLLMLDYSRAKSFDLKATDVLMSLKDFCLDGGAEKIVCVVRDEEDLAQHTHSRLMAALEGKEQFVLQPDEATWPAIEKVAVSAPQLKVA
ncbi:MAG: hypothetical protein KF784_11485 [Fimbriimonadaceae bacterium]|nr:hypothetical protein [Fimbriimonadaceae bacterium]